MTWISFGVAVSLFYTPVIGLSYIIQIEPIPLFLYNLGSWIFLSLALLILDRTSNIDLLSKAKLRNGMLYALRPYVSNNIAVVLASVILGYTVVRLLMTWVDTGLSSRLAQDFEWGIVVLSIFTLFAYCGFTLERQLRYEADIERNQRHRKQQQETIVIPTG